MEFILLIIIYLGAAIICALPGFAAGFFWDIERFKKWIFLALATICSLFLVLNMKVEFSLLNIIINFITHLLGIYFGALIFISFRNMAKKAGLCKICDKFRRKRENFNDN